MMPLINNFSGGIATGVDEYYLNPNHSTVLVNANVNRVGLISVSTASQVKACQKWFYQYPIEHTEPQEYFVCSSENYRSYAEFDGKLCYSNGGPHCRYTYGEMSAEEGIDDFIWYDMGAEAPEGKILARPLVLDDLVGATATLNEQVDGYINIEHVKYRVVHTEDQTETIYIKDFKENAGESTVDWVVPENTKVYRQLVNAYDEPVDRFLLVNQKDETEFTDGLEHIFYETECTRNSTVDNRASHRMTYYLGDGYTLHYKVEKTIEVEEEVIGKTCDKDQCGDVIDGTCKDVIKKTNHYTTKCTVDTMYKVLEDRYVPMQIEFRKEVTNTEKHLGAIASAFVYRNQMYIMITIGKDTSIFSLTERDEIYQTDTIKVPFEFHRGSTVEVGNSIYFFNPKYGKVGFFNGAFMVVKDMPKYPYSTANTSVFSGKDGIVYSIINSESEANLYAFTLPDMTPSLTGKERIKLDRIKSLGGTSGCEMYEDEYIVLPIEGKILRYNPDTHELKSTPNPEIYPSGSVKGFVYEGRNIICVSEYVIASCAESTKDMPEELDIKHLTGSYLYNVSQKTDDPNPIDGPIMTVEHDEVEIEYGHMRVDLSQVVHTNELRLYRTGGYLTRYTMVEDVDPTDVYIDRRDDVTIASGREGVYDKVEAPPEGIKWLTSHRGRLFGAIGNKLYWSELGKADYWDHVLSMLVLDQEITGLASGFNGLIIFMRHAIKLLAGSEALQFALKTVSMSQGTTKSYGIQAAGGGALFFSSDGLCFTDGITVKDLSYDMLGAIDFSVIDSAVTAKSYYALIENFMESDHQFVVLKQDINKEPLFTTLDGNQTTTLGIVDGKLAHQYDGYLYQTFEGDDLRTLSYRSGRLTVGELTMIKEWDRLRLTGEFIGLLTVYIDDRLVLSNAIDTSTPYNVHIPKNVNTGKSLIIEIEGTGHIYTIEYSITGRSTTK